MNPAPGAERLRAVLDTNIFIAAFHSPRGRQAALWRAARSGRYRLVVSPAIIRETARVLRRDFEWKDQEIADIVRLIVAVAREDIVVPRREIDAIKVDPETTAFWNARSRAGPTSSFPTTTTTSTSRDMLPFR